MRSYQIEYIANIKEAASLAEAKRPEGASSEDYAARRLRDQKRMEELAERNMFLLRRELFPLLDHLSVAEPETLEELREFAGQLLTGRGKQDIGLFCQIHSALLSLARQQKDRAGTIRELYWMGIGRNSQCNMLIGLDISIIELYSSAMRLYFTEAAAYLKYYDSLEDSETRGYVLRSRANMALGQFKYPSEKINLLRKTLRIMQDKGYREKAPELPWDRYLSMTQEMMAASVSYGKEKVMTPEDISTLMESVYLVYQKRIQEAELENQKPSVRWSFPYYAMEYYCGIYGLGTLLSRMEALMDRADPSDLSAEGLYGIISLPAFYCQYLNQNPELIPERRTYLERLYRRLLRYVDAFPATCASSPTPMWKRREVFPTGNSSRSSSSALRRRYTSIPGLWRRGQSSCAALFWRRNPPFLTTLKRLPPSRTWSKSAVQFWTLPRTAAGSAISGALTLSTCSITPPGSGLKRNTSWPACTPLPEKPSSLNARPPAAAPLPPWDITPGTTVQGDIPATIRGWNAQSGRW